MEVIVKGFWLWLAACEMTIHHGISTLIHTRVSDQPRDPTFFPEEQLERGMDGDEHQYLGQREDAAMAILDFRALRRRIRNNERATLTLIQRTIKNHLSRPPHHLDLRSYP
jgi:hypothetical protein